MNKVQFFGRLTKDVELRYTPSGVAVATFTLAVPRRFKKEGQPEADFIPVVIWQKAAENAANYLRKGSRTIVSGHMETRNYEGQDGKRVYITECISEEITFIDFAPGRQNGQQEPQNNSGNQSQGQRPNNGRGGQNGGYTRINDDPFAGNGQIDINDDDLPF